MQRGLRGKIKDGGQCVILGKECWREMEGVERRMMDEAGEFERYEEIVESVGKGIVERDAEVLKQVLDTQDALKREFVERITSEEWARKAEQVFRKADEVMDRGKLESRLRALKDGRKKHYLESRGLKKSKIERWLWQGVAAVVVGIAVWGGVELLDRGEIRNGDVERQMAKGVILRLEDGKEVRLDTLQQKLRQGSSEVMRTDARQLMYTEVSERRREGTVEDVHYNEVAVPRGGEFLLVLADGTKVWMNAESRLRFPVRFEGKARRVVLEEGEVYFEVKKQKEQEKWLPFVVEARGLEVKVLGTHFNVNMNRVDGVSETTLVEGKVAVRSNGGFSEEDEYGEKEWVVLEPDEQARVTDNAIKVRKVDAKGLVAWKDGVFRFEREKLEEIAAQLERWYDVQVVFMREELKEKPFTGVVFRDEALGKALEVIHMTAGVQYRENKGVVTIY